MPQPIEIELQSDRKMSPVIGTEVFDSNLPSQLNFKDQKGNKKQMVVISDLHLNPEDAGVRLDLGESGGVTGKVQLKEYRVRGKSIFDVESKYRIGDAVTSQKSKIFAAKAFNQENSRGLIVLWQAVVGYSKRQLLVQDGQFHILSPQKPSATLCQSLKLSKLLKFFIDMEQNKIRLVFKNEDNKSDLPNNSTNNSSSNNKRINKDFELQNRQSLLTLVQKILLECNVIGLEVIQDVI